MLRLVLSDLLANARIWLGLTVVAAATALVAAVAASDIETAAALGGTPGLALYGISGSVIVFTAVAAVVVLSSVADLTVVLQQRDYALWQLVGVPPTLVRAVVVTQLVLVALLGAVVGAGISAPLLQPFFDSVFAGTAGLDGTTVRFGPLGFGGVVVLVTLVVVVSGQRSARRASRVAGLAVLVDPDPPATRMRPLRWAGALLLLAVLVSVLSSLPGRPVAQLETPLMLVAPLVASLLVCLGPLVFPVVLRGWTSLLPPRLSASWFLARSGAAHSIGRSAAAINPLLLAIALAGGVPAAHETVAAATGAAPEASMLTQGLVLLLGGPLLLSVLGAVMTIFMSGRARGRESALVLASGGTPTLVLAVALGEAVIYVVTAALLATVAVLASALVGAWVVGEPGSPVAPSLGLGASSVTAAVELLLVAAATLASTVLGLRTRVAAVLAAE